MDHLFSKMRTNRISVSLLIKQISISKIFLCFVIIAALTSVKESRAEEHQDALIADCEGCHAYTRKIPKNGYFKIGLGKWTDQQCYGCHAEMNDVAIKRASGDDDPRYFAIPLDETKLLSLATSPLSYMLAPVLPAAENIASQNSKYSKSSLLLYLRRPFNVRGTLTDRPPQMPAFASESDAELLEVIKSLGLSLSSEEELSLSQASFGKGVWDNHCSSCHSQPISKVIPNRRGLSLFSNKWLFAYANGKVKVSQKRTMPIVSITAEMARQLSFYLKAELIRDYEQLDLLQRNSNKRHQKAVVKKIEDEFVRYLFNSFFMDKGCVHCHTGNNRMRARFEATGVGLENYVRQGKVSELVKRLQYRAIEVRNGIGGRHSGMPQSKDALNPNIIEKIDLWRQSGCPNQTGKNLCPSG